MNENRFSNISPKNENKPLEKKSEAGFSRRDLLKKMAAGTMLLATGKAFVDLATQETENDFSIDDQKKIDEAIAKIEAKYTPTKPQEKIDQEDIDIIGKTFAQQIEMQDFITLDATTRKAIYTHWYNKYMPSGENYKDGLIAGLERMKPWIVEIKDIFAQQNVPEELMYLAIPESHFDMNAISPKQAVGPYQITRHTSQLKKFNLIVTDDYDERYDPIKSAQLCAKHLRYGFKNFGGQNTSHNTTNESVALKNENAWQLSLMDYNGGLTNEYIEHIKQQEKTIDINIITSDTISQKNQTLSHLAKKYNTSVTLIKRANNLSDDQVRTLQIGATIKIPQERKIEMSGFNTWLENHINNIITRELTKTHYTVKDGDTIGQIAQHYSMSTEILMAINNLTTPDIRAGQKLQIPTLAKKAKEDILNLLSDFRENINYPEKFYAIFDIIKKENLTDRFSNTTKKYKEYPVPKIKKANFSYTFSGGDTISKMIQNLKKQYPQCDITDTTLTQMIIYKNKIKNVKSIQPGQTLSVAFPLEHPANLTTIASKNNIDITILQKLNPAIQNPETNLPENIKIRLPK